MTKPMDYDELSQYTDDQIYDATELSVVWVNDQSPPRHVAQMLPRQFLQAAPALLIKATRYRSSERFAVRCEPRLALQLARELVRELDPTQQRDIAATLSRIEELLSEGKS